MLQFFNGLIKKHYDRDRLMKFYRSEGNRYNALSSNSTASRRPIERRKSMQYLPHWSKLHNSFTHLVLY